MALGAIAAALSLTAGQAALSPIAGPAAVGGAAPAPILPRCRRRSADRPAARIEVYRARAPLRRGERARRRQRPPDRHQDLHDGYNPAPAIYNTIQAIEQDHALRSHVGTRP
jgi:hypothetical protein